MTRALPLASLSLAAALALLPVSAAVAEAQKTPAETRLESAAAVFEHTPALRRLARQRRGARQQLRRGAQRHHVAPLRLGAYRAHLTRRPDAVAHTRLQHRHRQRAVVPRVVAVARVVALQPHVVRRHLRSAA